MQVTRAILATVSILQLAFSVFLLVKIERERERDEFRKWLRDGISL